MNNKKATKRALLTSVMALVMCVVMLVGTTFAWFTDTASTGVNKIQAGNLDVKLEYKNTPTADFTEVDTNTKVFKDGALWEPGHVEYVVLKISNAGTLALKYKLGINIAGETGSTNVYGDPFKLSDSIKFAVIDGDKSNLGRDNLVAAAMDSKLIKDGYTSVETPLYPAGTEGKDAEKTVTLVVWMPTDVGNEANHKTGAAAPTIDLGIKVDATQYTYEKDSIDDQYDKDAGYLIQVNKDNIQDYLDGKYGSIDGMTLVLAAGDYGRIEFGRATAYAGSNTKYYLKNRETTVDAIKQAIAAHPHGGAGTPTYIRSMNNVTLKAADGATVTVAGIDTFGGQAGAGRYDYVVERAVTSSNDCYYLTHRWNNIVFEGISFTDAVNIDAFQSATVINGIKFDNCSFTVNDDTAQTRCLRLATGGDCKSAGLAVTNCKFYDGYEGVLTIATTDVTVSGCTFTGLSKNAIDLLVGTNGYGKVTVTNNTIQNMGNGDGVILRLGDVDAKAALTIKDNTASGELRFKGDLAIKVNSLANGITYDISNNNWGSLGVSHTALKG